MQDIILTNNDYKVLSEYITDIESSVSKIDIASAFYSENAIMEKWKAVNQNIRFIVSLRPPTSYYALKNIISNPNIDVKYLGSQFHSKFFIFYMDDIPNRAIIGSSNFTNGGLSNNIETNYICDNTAFAKDLSSHFDNLWEKANSLDPAILEKYKTVYDSFCKRSSIPEEEAFENEISKHFSGKKIKSSDLIKEAKQYLLFWKAVDEVKDNIVDISKAEYPGIAVYLVIDHFWHWIKTVWGKENSELPSPNWIIIRSMFKEYCRWDKNGSNHTIEMKDKSENIFQAYLSRDHILELTRDQAIMVYQNLHSGEARSNRFSSDQKFVDNNSINKISASLSYLLYSNEDIVDRIHKMAKDDQYKLEELGLSGIQEILGWVYSEKYPMRNLKADSAVKMIGYRI